VNRSPVAPAHLGVAGVLVALIGLVAIGAPPGQVVAAGIWGGTALRLSALARRRRARRDRADRSQEACLTVASELRSGRTPAVALAQAAAADPVLEVPRRAAAMGHDPLPSLRVVAEGHPGYSRLVVAWQLSVSTGVPLASAVDRVATDLSVAADLVRLASAEMAPARATALVLAVLPVGTLLAGGALGFDVGSALASPVGQATSVVGAFLAAVGLVWVERLGERAVPQAGESM
jgi:tight adherence protein B